MAKRVLFLMSDTGGGHRAAATAIADALKLRYGDSEIDATLVDVYKQCLFPLNYMPEFYPFIVHHGPRLYGMSYHSSNTRFGVASSTLWMYFTSGHRLRKMVQDNPADVVVSVHSVITRPSMKAFEAFDSRPPFLTVVTDLVSTHRFWYENHVERCFVPTQAAYDRGVDAGLDAAQLCLTGLPVHPGFTEALRNKAEARQQLGWSPDAITILMVGGGEGMGPLLDSANAINALNLPCQLAVISGKNKELKAKLEAINWNQPTHIYGFVDNMREMPLLMAAADILVTKAGPATISEACIAGLPMIIYDAIPGQEEGNVDFVVDNAAGVFAPSPELVAQAVADWLDEGSSQLHQRADNALKLGKPNAVWEIADEIWQYAHHPMIQKI